MLRLPAYATSLGFTLCSCVYSVCGACLQSVAICLHMYVHACGRPEVYLECLSKSLSTLYVKMESHLNRDLVDLASLLASLS